MSFHSVSEVLEKEILKLTAQYKIIMHVNLEDVDAQVTNDALKFK